MIFSNKLDLFWTTTLFLYNNEKGTHCKTTLSTEVQHFLIVTLSAVMLYDIMLSGIVLNVVVLSVMTP
jgi:hypothetical protein